jgi:tight adherence protein B
MQEAAVLGLIFAAVVLLVRVVTPLLAQIGVERSLGRYGDVAASAAMRHFTTPERLARACWMTALAGAGLLAAALIAAGVLQPVLLTVLPLAVGFLGFQIPKVWLRRRIRKRLENFEARLVDLTLGLANGLRSGAALPQSLELVSRDLGGVMTEEFNLVLHEYRLGIDLPECLERLCERMPCEDLALMVTSIRLTMQSGGSLAEVLEKITGTIRERTEFHQRLRTMTEQGRFEAIAMAFAPLVTFGILYYLDPELMRPMVTTPLGWTALGAVVVLETLGFLIINKIVTIKV